jgi:hypothetical protein
MTEKHAPRVIHMIFACCIAGGGEFVSSIYEMPLCTYAHACYQKRNAPLQTKYWLQVELLY